MPSYLAPDVYVEEIDSGNQPIEGVSTSVTGFVGVTQRGPSSGLPQLVTSYSQFTQIFGSYFDWGPTYAGHNSLPFAADGFFTNLGSLLYVSRVLAPGATDATVVAQGGLTTRLTQDTSLAAALSKQFRPATLRGIQVGTAIVLRMIKNGITTDSAVLQVTAVDRTTGIVTVNTALTSIFEAKYTAVLTDVDALDAGGGVTKLASPTAARPNTFTINAANEGSWGKQIVLNVSHESAGRAVLDAWISGGVDNNQFKMKSTANFYVNAWVEIDRGNVKFYRKVLAVNGLVVTLAGPALAAADVAPQLAAPNDVTYFNTTEFRLTAAYGGQTEQFPGLTLENVPGRYYVDQINNLSQLIQVVALGAPGPPFLFPSGDDGITVMLTGGGVDGTAAPADDDYIGQDNGPGQRTGLQALIDIDEVSIIAIPGITSQAVQNAMISHCESLQYRFAILDPDPKSLTPPVGADLNGIQSQRNQYDTKYAALYYPRVVIESLLTSTKIPLAPSGHIAGIYARVDDQRGVHKAPANEVINGIVDLETLVNKFEQEILNPDPVNINVNRDFRSHQRGLRVWGARCITSVPQWKYINVRRLFIFIEKSIEVGTQWAVFEPNNEALWARVTQSVTLFLTRVWRSGALLGTKPEEAFFVKCDRTTMTQDDLDNGRLIMIIGIAPTKPAEFVIVRIGQWAGGSSVAEL
jgi:phage tail sheath protein FI